jgi:hypothetical protein
MYKSAEDILTKSKELPFWIRRRALNNIKNQNQANVKDIFYDIFDVLGTSFTWAISPEKFKFWNHVFIYLENPKSFSLPTAKDIPHEK